MRYLLLASLLFVSHVGAQEVGIAENPRILVRTDIQNTGSLSGAVLSPTGERVAVYGYDAGNPNLPKRPLTGTLQIWDVGTRKMVFNLVAHRDSVEKAIWSHDGKRVVSQGQNGTVILWDANTGKQLRVLAAALEMPSFGRKGDKIAAPEKAWQLWTNFEKRPKLLGFSPDDRQVLALGNQVDLPATLDKTKAAKFFAAQNFKTPLLLAWNADDGQFARSVAFGKKGARNDKAALSADGKRFVVAHSLVENGQDIDKQIEIRDVASGALQSATPLGDTFNYVAHISDDGSRAVLVQWTGKEFVRDRAQLWDVFAHKPLQVLADDETDFLRSEFSHDGSQLLVSGRAGEIEIFALPAGNIQRRLGGGHCSTVSTLQLSRDGQTLVSMGAQESRVQVWDLSLPESALPMPHAIARTLNARSVVFAPDGSFWSGWGHSQGDSPRVAIGLILEHYAPTGKTLETFSIPSEFLIDNVTFSPDFRLAVGALESQDNPRLVIGEGVGVWDIAQKKMLWHLPNRGTDTDTFAFSPDSQILATGQSHGNKIQLWNLRDGTLLRTLPEPTSGTGALRFAPDGQSLAIGSLGGTIVFYDLKANNFTGEITEDGAVTNLALSPDGKYLLSGGDITVGYKHFGFKVHLWDVQSGRIFREWKQDHRFFGGATFSPDGQALALCHFESDERSGDSRIELWNIADNTLTATLRDICGARQPTFAPDGKTLVTTDWRWLKSWDVANILMHKAP